MRPSEQPLGDDQLIEYKDKWRQLLLAYCRLYYKVQAYFIKFPRYSRKFYLENISTLPDYGQFKIEKQLWRQWTPFNRFSWSSFLFVAYHLLMCLKYFGFAYYMMRVVDFKRPEMNLIEKEGNEGENYGWFQFACMRTNCTRLSSNNQLAHDLVQLPVFSICQPRLSWFYNPMINLHQIGLILIGVFLFFILVASVMEPTLAMLACCPLRLAAFISCPNLLRQLELQRTRKFCKMLAESYENYQLNMTSLSSSLPLRRFSCCFSTNERDEQSIGMSVNHLQCLPINATKWWHQQLLSVFSMASILFSWTVLLLVAFFNQWAHYYLSKSPSEQFANYFEYMRTESNCSIWTTHSTDEAHSEVEVEVVGKFSWTRRTPLKLDNISSNYNEYTSVEFAFGLLTIQCLFSAAVNGFYQSANDIQINMNELKFQLDVAVQLANLRLMAAKGDQVDQLTRGDNQKSCMFSLIRGKFMQISSYLSGMIVTKRLKRLRVTNKTTTTTTTSKLEHKLACQELAQELLERFGCSGELFGDLLDKIQISYWNFAHLIGEHERPLSGLLFLCYLINFGFSLISVYMSSKFLAYQLLSLLVNIIAVMTLNIYIASASIVHSRAKKLETCFWSLIAMNCSESHQRIRHSSQLAIKQLALIDANGGLALRTFGFNVTYVRIIEVSFWTTSIILLAYTRH